MVKVDIVNVVLTADLNQRIDLNEIGKLEEILHNPDTYGGRVAYFRSHRMKGTVSIFASGKMISVGTKSEEEAIQALEYTKEFLVKKSFIKPTILKPKTRNIVLLANFEKTIELETLAKKYNMIYEPEQFPGGIIRTKEPCKATVLLFASGKAVITGLKSLSQINPTLQKIANIVASSL